MNLPFWNKFHLPIVGSNIDILVVSNSKISQEARHVMKEKEKEKVMIIKGKTQLCSAMYVQYDCVIRI